MPGVYLDHSGTTIYAKSAIESFTSKMLTNLYGNPHSENSPAKLASNVVEDVRLNALEFLGADPNHFDLVFVANATAGIKLVGEAFRDLGEKTRSNSFWYGYHIDSHTSLIGVREWTYGQSHCFESDAEVEAWLRSPASARIHRQDHRSLGLFAYPGQSNLTGRRLPLAWAGHMRRTDELQNTYTLLDAAALAMTFPMSRVFADPGLAPDFTCLSFYKIFGFPDVGALVIRKQSGHILNLRKYFGGGTVHVVSVLDDVFHQSKGRGGPEDKLHEGLEDGTLPFHSILALGEAIDVHRRLFKSMEMISDHTQYLAARLRQGLMLLRHTNGRPMCRVYSDGTAARGGIFTGNSDEYGSAIAFNVLDENSQYIPFKQVEESADKANIYVRSGGEPSLQRVFDMSSCLYQVHLANPTQKQVSAILAGSTACSPMSLGCCRGHTRQVTCAAVLAMEFYIGRRQGKSILEGRHVLLTQRARSASRDISKASGGTLLPSTFA